MAIPDAIKGELSAGRLCQADLPKPYNRLVGGRIRTSQSM